MVASFGRELGELRIALMLGGDIRYRTRVLTTAVVHETMLEIRRGHTAGCHAPSPLLAANTALYALGSSSKG